MRSIWADCRHAFRLYCRTPVSSAIAALGLAVAIASCAAVLSLYVDLVRPHPGFEQVGRVASLAPSDSVHDWGLPYAAIKRLSGEVASIDAAASVYFTSTLVEEEGDPIQTALVSDEFFSALRPRLALGSGFEGSDVGPDSEPVAVISYRFWQQRFGGRTDVVGTLIDLARNPADRYMGPGIFPVEPEVDRARFRIVGVLADSVAGLGAYEPEVWLPIERAFPLFVAVPQQLPNTPQKTFVRMRQGASAANVLHELNAMLTSDEPIVRISAGQNLIAANGIVGNLTVDRNAKRQLRLFMWGGVLMLAVAAANISLFLLARAPGRRKELGIRLAVGATAPRLARQLATESALLVAAATGPALIASIWLGRFLSNLPLLREADWEGAALLDWRVMGAIAPGLLVVTLLVSLAPILSIRKLRIADMSRHASARASLAQRIAGTVQIVAAGTFAAAAIAFATYLGSTMFGNPGFELDNRYVIERAGAMTGRATNADILVELQRRREIIEGIPGVSAVAFGDPVPGEEFGRRSTYSLELDSGRSVDMSWGTVNREFIDLLGLRLIHGRAPEADELNSVLVNQTLARSIWGREDVVGEILPIDDREVVGVLADISYYHLAAPVPPFAFSLMFRSSNLWAVVEADLTPAQLTQELDRLVAAGELDIQSTEVRSLREMLYESIAPDRARGMLTIASTVLIVVLSAIGFYGTQLYLVTAGRKEYAVRAALGAGPRKLGRLVHWRGLMLGLPGLVLSGLSALIVVEKLRDGLIPRSVSSGLVVAAVMVGLVLFMQVANFGPARAARRTQPASVLREE